MHLYWKDLGNCSSHDVIGSPDDVITLDNDTDDSNSSWDTGDPGATVTDLDREEYLGKLHVLTVFVVGLAGLLVVSCLIFSMCYNNERMAEIICRGRSAEEVYDRTSAFARLSRSPMRSSRFFGPTVTPVTISAFPMLVAGAALPLTKLGAKRCESPTPSHEIIEDPFEGVLSAGKPVTLPIGRRPTTPSNNSDTGSMDDLLSSDPQLSSPELGAHDSDRGTFLSPDMYVPMVVLPGGRRSGFRYPRPSGSTLSVSSEEAHLA